MTLLSRNISAGFRAFWLCLYIFLQMPCVLWFLLVGKLCFSDNHPFTKLSRTIVPPLSTGVYLLFLNIRLAMQVGAKFPPPKTAARFLVMTHSSTADFMVVTSAFWMIHGLMGPIICLVKKELLTMPYFGWLQVVVGSVAVGRSGDIEAAKKSIAIGELRSREGYMVSGFPEGTRRRSPSCGRDQIQPLKKGMFHLAHNVADKESFYIVPMVLMGANAAWPAKHILPIPGSKITVRVGDPIEFEPKTSVDDIANRVRSRMQDELEHAGAVGSSGTYSADNAFQQGVEMCLWKMYGFEAVIMLIPALVTIGLAMCGKL